MSRAKAYCGDGHALYLFNDIVFLSVMLVPIKGPNRRLSILLSLLCSSESTSAK